MVRKGLRHSRVYEARQLYDIYSILGIPTNKKLIVCPLPQHPHHNNTPSFSISMKDGHQHFHCFGACGASGDVIDLIGYLQISNYDSLNGEHVRRALEILSAGYKISPPARAPRTPALPNDIWETFVPPGAEVLEYAKMRGLKPETLKKFMVGQSGMFGKTWMTMPAFHFGRLQGIKMRNVHAVHVRDRYASMEGSINGLFNLNGIYYSPDPILIVKGEIAAMLLDQYGFLVCAPTAGESTACAELLPHMIWSSRRILVADNDPDPKVRRMMDEYAVKRAEMLRAEIKRPPEQYKDIDDFLLAEPKLALAAVEGWLK